MPIHKPGGSQHLHKGCDIGRRSLLPRSRGQQSLGDLLRTCALARLHITSFEPSICMESTRLSLLKKLEHDLHGSDRKMALFVLFGVLVCHINDATTVIFRSWRKLASSWISLWWIFTACATTTIMPKIGTSIRTSEMKLKHYV